MTPTGTASNPSLYIPQHVPTCSHSSEKKKLHRLPYRRKVPAKRQVPCAGKASAAGRSWNFKGIKSEGMHTENLRGLLHTASCHR
eukprot:4916303-Prorocentrum_lima.AAC.1